MGVTASSLVEVTGLTVRYGSVTALSGVSFSLGHGVTGLLGPNGAGKSSLLRSMATAQVPTAGDVTAGGLTLTAPSQRRAGRRMLGYLPQDPGFYPRFRVEEFVDHVALLKEIADRSQRRAEVERVLGAVDLLDRRGERIARLSGGMRQRLALACAIVGDPRLLILDEPTVGLDPEQRIRFRELIGRLGQRHTVVLSTHQTDDVSSLCSRVIVLKAGRIWFSGTPAELRACAEGHVWSSPVPDPAALAAWETGDGSCRNLGDPPYGAPLLPPTLDDGYLILTAEADGSAVA